jgi:peptide subunit release factor 1 (eRF1)
MSGMPFAKPQGMTTIERLTEEFDRIAALDAGPFPVISLYLDLRPNEHGRDQFEPFLRKELTERVNMYPSGGPERESLEADAARIRDYVSQVDGSANSLAVFACHAADLFTTLELAAPIDGHRLYVADHPHLYPLARVVEKYPRFLALVTDTHSARIFVFAINELEKTEQVEGAKPKHHKKGGWSQARYQRHTENLHLQHAKEVVDHVARIVREEGIDKIVVAAEEVIMPLLQEHFPKDISDRIVDVLKLDVRANERAVLEATVAALRKKDQQGDRERVDELINAYRANGLACVGRERTRRALEMGQVDELLIGARPDGLAPAGDPASMGNSEMSAGESIADELVVQARNTSAAVRFIEEPALLAPIGGVGAFLRFKL